MGGFVVRRSDNPDQYFLIEPQAGPLHDWILHRLSKVFMAQIFPRWNPLTSWMRQVEDLQRAA